ncbi:MAG: HAMP domain-containing protein [Ignavibacteria bacterium]|nr:MAG: HAMP domain-containing protein [Ignavibacteria bacterium]
MALLFRSIRARIILWYSLVLLATLVAFGLIAFMYSGERLSQSLDRSLKTEVVWVKNFIEGKSSKVRASRKYGAQVSVVPAGDTTLSRAQVADTGSGDEAIWNEIYAHAVSNPKKTLVEVTNKWGAIPFRSFGASEESLMVRAEALIGTDIPIDSVVIKTLHDPNGMDLRVAGTKTSELEIYVAYPLAEVSEALGNLFSIFLILIPAAMALSVGGGWFLAYQSLKPVDMVTKTAHAITVNNLKQQIPARDVDDEIGRLISTFNRMISRLSESFDQIRQFSIAASHELRTPLTIMRGEVELALRKEKDPAEYRRVLVSNLEELVRLSSIVESLLTMSKADFEQQEVQYEEVRMKDLLEEFDRHRRPDQAASAFSEPDRQRHQVYARTGAGLGFVRAPRRLRESSGAGYGSGDPGGGTCKNLRPFLSRRQGPLTRDGRERPGARDREVGRGTSPGAHRGNERGGEGDHVHSVSAAVALFRVAVTLVPQRVTGQDIVPLRGTPD